jgi:hypothetical protein
MRVLPFSLILFFIIFCTQCKQKEDYTLSKMRGKWINQQNDFVEINDTLSDSFIFNYLYLNGKGGDKYLEINNDTLSFQNRYYSSKTNFNNLHIDRYDFLLKTLSDSFMELSPISSLAKDLACDENLLKLIRQEYLVDNTIQFEKIIFHTTFCYGSCPIYHLEIDSNKNCKLHRELVYKEGRARPYLKDSAKIGYFYGNISDQIYEDLTKEIKTCNLKSLEFDDVQCCDGPIFTLIIFYNGKTKYLKSMTPPRTSINLINKLMETCDKVPLHSSCDTFKLIE